MKQFLQITPFAISFFLFSSFVEARPAKKRTLQFKASDHCVAYKTKKRVMMLSRATVFGKNCQLSIAQKMIGDQVQIDLSVPVSSFESGEKLRDRLTPGLLKLEKGDLLSFVSKSFPKRRLKEKEFEVEGVLNIGKLQKMIKIPVQVDSTSIKGVYKTTYSDLGLEVPSVAGGFVAKVYDTLELHFQLKKDKLGLIP